MKKNLFVILMLGFYYSLLGQSYDVIGDYKVSGKVGIGNASPGYLLDIGSGSKAGVINVINNNYGDWILRKSRSDNTQITGFKSFEYGRLGVFSNNIEAMSIHSNNIGIGTTDPKYILDIGCASRPGLINIVNNDDEGWILRKSRSDNTHILGLKFFWGGEIGIYANSIEGIHINTSGNVGIGTDDPGDYKLAVEGTIGAREVKVTLDGWSDFVFDAEYEFRSLTDLEKFINENNRLPDMPSEEEVIKNGVSLGEMNAKLLQKIEELTLYMIEQNKIIKDLQIEVKNLKN